MKRPAADSVAATLAVPERILKRVSTWDTVLSELFSWVEVHSSWPRQNSAHPVEASLATWMNHQRQAKSNESLTQTRVAGLEGLPRWSWDPQPAQWNNAFTRVKTWVAEHGSLPNQGAADPVETSCAKWMNNQRQAKSNATLTHDRAVALETWSGWTWQPQKDQWQVSLGALQLWLSEHEQRMPQRNSQSHAEAALAEWADNQRKARQKGILSEERSCAVEHLSGWTWQPREEQWETWYQLAWDWFFGPPCSPEAPRSSYPRSTKDLGLRPLSLESVLEGEVQCFNDGFEDDDSEHLASHPLQETSPARALALWMLRQRMAYRLGMLPESRSLRLQQLPRWTWTRVGGELEPQQAWAHHFKHLLAWLQMRQGRTPCAAYPVSAFERRLGEWYDDNLGQFRNATSDPTYPGGCSERVKLAPRKSKVPETEEEWLSWGPIYSSALTREERLHWVKTLPNLFGGRFWSWYDIDFYLKVKLSVPEKSRSPLRHPDKNQEWGPDWTAFLNRIDPSILAPRASDYIRVRSPPMPWERVRLFMQLLRDTSAAHMRIRGNTRAQELLVEVDTSLIAQGAHKRHGSRVGCPCCVPELHVCRSFPILRRCCYCSPPYEFVCTEGVWRCKGQWNCPLITISLSPPLPSGQLSLDAFSFRPTSASNDLSSA